MIMGSAEPTAKAGWGEKILGEVCDILDNQRKPITKRNRVAGPFPYYGATGVLDHVEGFLFDEELVLVGEDGAKWDAGENSAFPISGKCWVNNHAHVLRPNRSEVLDQWLVSYLNYSDLSEYITGLTVPKLNQGKLREIPIPVPPLAEQERIVGILDEAFEGIATATAQAEKNLHNARELFQSVLQSTFSQKGDDWVETTLPEICKDYGRGKSKHRPRNEPKLYGGPYPFIQTGDLSGADHILTEHNQTYSDFGLSQSKLWPQGTACVAIVGATVGESAVLDFEACFPDSVIGFVTDELKADGLFVEYLLQAFKELLKERGKGTARDNINMGTFTDQKFPIPPLPTQQAIVEKLDALSEETKRLEAIYERKKAALTELKQSLLQKAFAGEL